MGAGPYPAFSGTVCDSCDEHVPMDDGIYFIDSGDKLCGTCADDSGYVCSCGKYKAEEYDNCYSCNAVKIFPTGRG